MSDDITNMLTFYKLEYYKLLVWLIILLSIYELLLKTPF